MRVTEKDELIYHYIDDMGFATVKHISDLFYSNIEYGRVLARKRLTCLIEHGYIRETKSANCNQLVFYTDRKNSRKTQHAIIVMDLYVKFKQIEKMKVLYFKREEPFGNKKVISDAFLTVKYPVTEGIAFQNFIIEVQTSNNDFKSVLSKYNNDQVINDIAIRCDGLSPIIIYVDNTTHNMDKVKCPYKVVQIGEKLSDFPLIFESH